MPRKVVWTVRVIQPSTDAIDQMSDDYMKRLERMNHFPGVWVEQFRRLGIIRVLEDNEKQTILEIRPPDEGKGMETRVWADQNAERMKSFGINAAAAPEWLQDGDREAPFKKTPA